MLYDKYNVKKKTIWNMKCEKCNIIDTMWQMQRDILHVTNTILHECNVTNATWQMQCYKYSVTNATWVPVAQWQNDWVKAIRSKAT